MKYCIAWLWASTCHCCPPRIPITLSPEYTSLLCIIVNEKYRSIIPMVIFSDHHPAKSKMQFQKYDLCHLCSGWLAPTIVSTAQICYQVFLNICQKNFSDIRQVFAKRICQMPVMYTGTCQQKMVSLIQN